MAPLTERGSVQCRCEHDASKLHPKACRYAKDLEGALIEDMRLVREGILLVESHE